MNQINVTFNEEENHLIEKKKPRNDRYDVIRKKN